MNKLIITFALAALAFGAVADETGGTRGRGRRQLNPEAKLHRFSTTVEKERPKLNQETKDLIAAYRRNPSDANRTGLRDGTAAYRPVLGAQGRNVSIGATPVTEADWAKFAGTSVSTEKARHPVVGVSVTAAEKYCAWLSANDPKHTYRLPTEAEWELAAGHMPKDADFNCGIGGTRTAVDAFGKTKGACGGVDFWATAGSGRRLGAETDMRSRAARSTPAEPTVAPRRGARPAPRDRAIRT